MIEGHGDDLYRYGDKVKINFSTNILVTSHDDGLAECLSRSSGLIGNYPEPTASGLERRIAFLTGVAPECVVVTNGATDAIYRLALMGRRGRSAVSRPSFREYQDACVLHEHSVSFFDKLDEIDSTTGMVWLCNPNNPTGQVWPKADILDLAARCCDSVVVVDQAYADYTDKELPAPNDVVAKSNMVVLSSMTKRFGVPGIRLGYAIASAPLANELRASGQPWCVGSVALAVGHHLLDHSCDYKIDTRRLMADAQRLADNLRQLGIKVEETHCNFMLCQLPKPHAAELKEYLVDKHGMLIRDASNFEGLSGGHFRVSTQGRHNDSLLINAIGQWMKYYMR